MAKSSQEKIEYAKQLLRAQLPYREVQESLKIRFGSGMSNTTLQKLISEEDEIKRLKEQLAKANNQLELYKRLYHELLQKIQNHLKD